MRFEIFCRSFTVLAVSAVPFACCMGAGIGSAIVVQAWLQLFCGALLLPQTFRKTEVQGGPGSVRFGYGSGVERFERFRFSVPAVPLQKGFSLFQYCLTGKEGSGSGFGSWKTVPAVPVPLSVSGKTVPTVPVPGSGSVPEPPWRLRDIEARWAQASGVVWIAQH